MKKICGLEDSVGDECFLKWFCEVFAKHLVDVTRTQVIEAVDQSWILEDAEVPLSSAN